MEVKRLLINLVLSYLKSSYPVWSTRHKTEPVAMSKRSHRYQSRDYPGNFQNYSPQ